VYSKGESAVQAGVSVGPERQEKLSEGYASARGREKEEKKRRIYRKATVGKKGARGGRASWEKRRKFEE